jgi:hypothetical protein
VCATKWLNQDATSLGAEGLAGLAKLEGQSEQVQKTTIQER